MAHVTKMISNADLTKSIASTKRRAASLAKDIQANLIQSLLQMQPTVNGKKFDNYDFAGQQILAMSGATRRNAAITYIQSHSPAVAQFEGKKFTGFKKNKAKDAVKLDIVAAEQVNFWDFKVESEPTTIDLEAMTKRVENLFKVADKNLNDADMALLKKTIRLQMAA